LKDTNKSIAVPDSTQSICPECKKIIPATFSYNDDGKVYMKKRCSEHGETVSLVSSDSKMYRESFAYNMPGKLHLIRSYATEYTGNCPLDCGVCPEHLQHTCSAMIEVTNRCNLNCPVCYMDANIGSEKTPTREEIKGMLELLLRSEMTPPAINFTGGEATIRNDLVELVSMAHSMGFGDITVSTNGVVVSRRPELLKDLAAAGLTEVAISLDGLNDEVFMKTRGVPLYETKVKAIDFALNAGLSVTISATLVPDVNIDQIGSIIEFAKKRHLDGVNFAPMAYVGRYPEEFRRNLDRVTIPDVLRKIEDQTQGELTASDFVPVPCPDNRCSAMTYAFNDGAKLYPLTDYIDVRAYLDVYGDKVSCGPAGCDWVSVALDKLWSMSAIPGSGRVLKSIDALSPPARPAEDVMTISVHAFQDALTLDVQRLRKCCIHMVTTDKLIPFCVYNNLVR
jgi:uncharacterized radical SAM superfamily Fe-S cluster-containing enzyme